MRFQVLALPLILGVPVFAMRQSMQTPAIRPAISAFQVATISPSKPDESLGIQIVGHRFSVAGASLIDILKYAYGVHVSQIAGGPEWLAKERFDILADPETESRPASDEMKRMVQQLVAERFQLKFHRAQRELPVYAIVVAKSGQRLTPAALEENSIPAVGFSPSGKLGVKNATMTDLAAFLQRFVMDRPVVDQTGIAGKYDLSLSWTPDDVQSSGSVSSFTKDANAPPGLYTAIQEQLGLKLEAAKALTDVLVIDHVEQPSAN